MKKTRGLWLVMMGVWCGMAAPAQAQDVNITVAADRWCPYNCEPESNHPGFMIEIVKRALERHNIHITYNIMPWARAIEEARQGKLNAIIGAAHDDAPDFVFATIAQAWSRDAFYIKKGNPWVYRDLGSLEEVSLGAIEAYSYDDELDAYLKGHKNDLHYVQLLSGNDALANNVKKLLAGRIGAVLEDEHVMEYYLAKQGLDTQVEKAPSATSRKPDELYIAFSPALPESKKYAEIMGKEMKAMRDNGELQEILAQYLIIDWKP